MGRLSTKFGKVSISNEKKSITINNNRSRYETEFNLVFFQYFESIQYTQHLSFSSLNV